MRYVIGNWKMNGLGESISEVRNIFAHADQYQDHVKTILCIPFPYIFPFREKVNGAYGGQTCHHENHGAYTGDVSAEMLKECGADYVIIGHSERRCAYSQKGAEIQKKIVQAQNHSLTPILCVGESLEVYKAGKRIDFVVEQLKDSLPENMDWNNVIIAYEPIWAIGTGLIPTQDEITEMHTAIYNAFCALNVSNPAKIPILYGGSAKADNAQMIAETSHVHGVLVGGASLKADSFNPIISIFNR